MAVQLRRYEVVPGEMDGFIEWFPRIVAVREQYGFKVEFAFADRENNEFVWAVSHDGDFDAAFEVFANSPERAAAFEGQPKRVDEIHLAMVDAVIAPGG
jgi:heme-degrading monooxygenase HmoA